MSLALISFADRFHYILVIRTIWNLISCRCNYCHVEENNPSSCSNISDKEMILRWNSIIYSVFTLCRNTVEVQEVQCYAYFITCGEWGEWKVIFYFNKVKAKLKFLFIAILEFVLEYSKAPTAATEQRMGIYVSYPLWNRRGRKHATHCISLVHTDLLRIALQYNNYCILHVQASNTIYTSICHFVNVTTWMLYTLHMWHVYVKLMFLHIMHTHGNFDKLYAHYSSYCKLNFWGFVLL